MSVTSETCSLGDKMKYLLCPKCQSELSDAPGIGLFCANIECDIVDNIVGTIKCKHIPVTEYHWISVNDMLPDHNQRVLYFFEYTGTSVGKYDAEHDCFHSPLGCLTGDVTHWMPAPDEPAGYSYYEKKNFS